MKKLGFILAIIFLFTSTSFAQRKGQAKMDSLISELPKAKDDTNKIKLLYTICNYFYAINPNEGIKYGQRALSLTEKLKWRNGYFMSNICLGNNYTIKSDYYEALDCYLKSLKTAEEMGNRPFISSCFLDIGAVYLNQNDYPKALDYFFKALKISEELKLNDRTAMLFSNIGSIYESEAKKDANNVLRDSLYSQSLIYYFKALRINEDLGVEIYKANDLCSIGVVYEKQAENEQISDKIINDSLYSDGINYFFKALKISNEIGDKKGMALEFQNIGAGYLNEDKLKEADKFLHGGLTLAMEVGSLELIKDGSKDLSELYTKRGNWKEAYTYYKQSIVAEDSIDNKEKAKQQTRLEMNYEFDKKQATAKAEQDKKDVITNAEIGKQKVIRNSIAGGGGVLILSSIFIFFFYKRRNDAEQKQKEAEFNRQVSDIEMKALRAQMNPHFIFNSLQSIQTFLLQKNAEEANTYLIKFSKLMRLVLENSQHAEVPLKEDILALELYLQLESLRLKHPFTYNIKVDEDIDEESVGVPPLILQPFVENAIWHGLQYKKDSGNINIYIHKKEGALICTVEDNGVGREISKTLKVPVLMKKESLGMKLTEERLNILSELKKVQAYFNITDLFNPEHKPSGTRVELFLPLAT